MSDPSAKTASVGGVFARDAVSLGRERGAVAMLRGEVMMRKKTAGSRREGFILLEVMLAISIVGISCTVILGSLSAISRSKSTITRYATAMFLLDQKFQEVSLQDPSLWRNEGVFDAPFDYFSWTFRAADGPFRDFKKISLGVSWNNGTVPGPQIFTYIRENQDERVSP